MSVATVVLAYWAPLYVTVDTEDGKVLSIRLPASGMRNSVRVSGQQANGSEREALRIFAEARAEQQLPEVELC
jgi:hypothetical protein